MKRSVEAVGCYPAWPPVPGITLAAGCERAGARAWVKRERQIEPSWRRFSNGRQNVSAPQRVVKVWVER